MASFIDRVASTDNGYISGDISLYPIGLDNKTQLYTVSNNAQTLLTQSASFNSPYFIVGDTSSFPDKGIIMVGTEQVYYTIRTPNSFRGLKRGFANSRQDTWSIGTTVLGAVCAEPHNALKDATINIERNLGTLVNPDSKSLNGILKSLETRFLSPRPNFRADPRFGTAPHTVKFQNFSEGPAIRYFWDFGDGANSQEISPTHVYQTNGDYTVTLNVITSLGAQGESKKTDYISISNIHSPSFFYTIPTVGTTSTTFNFVDQSDGLITSRYWVWDDGNSTSFTDPDIHTATHQYTSPGTYNPSLLLIFTDDTKKVVRASETITVG